jgi:hypothetical protein
MESNEEPWLPFLGQYWKRFYDVRTHDGTEHLYCWPNGGDFITVATGARSTSELIAGADVAEFRYRPDTALDPYEDRFIVVLDDLEGRARSAREVRRSVLFPPDSAGSLELSLAEIFQQIQDREAQIKEELLTQQVNVKANLKALDPLQTLPAHSWPPPPAALVAPPHPGHRPFVIDGRTVWALNLRNAQRKARQATAPAQ